MRRKEERKRKTRGSQSGRLRIVAGKWRSRLLPVVDVPGLRPTSERVRETLFNWLGTNLAGARCLDLFAGTGALGLEALSRGADSVVFVEKSKTAVTALHESIRLLDATNGIVKEMDALAYIGRDDSCRYDVVFLDPPFVADLCEELCRLLAGRGWLATGAYVYLEQDRDHQVPELPDGWRLVREKTTGNVRYSLINAN